MAGAAMQGLFGPGADEVRQAIEQQGQAQDMAYAQMPMGRGPVALMASAGRNLGNVVNGIAGREDPRVAKAKAMQDAAQEVDSQGFSLMKDSQEYYKAAYASLMKRGLTQEAAHVRDLAINEQATQADIGLKQAQAKAALSKDRYRPIGKGGLFDTQTGEKVAEGAPGTVSANEQIISLYKPGTTRKGTDAPTTYNMDVPEQRQAAIEAMNKGWIRAQDLPGPEGAGTQVTINDKRDLNNTEWQQDVVKPEVQSIISSASSADKIISDARSANDLLMNGDPRTGFAAPEINTLARFANFIGVDEETLGKLSSNPSDTATLNAINSRVTASIASSLAPGSKQLSARELQLASNTAPQIWQTRSGQYFLNKYMEAKALHDKEIANKTTEIYAQKEYQDNPMLGLQKINEYKSQNPFYLSASMIDDFKKAYKEANEIKNLPDAVQLFKEGKLKTVNQVVRYKGRKAYFLGMEQDEQGRPVPIISETPKR